MIKVIILIAIITLGVITCSSNSGKALIDAAMDGNFEKVKLLIEKGADVNAKNNNGQTALMYASREGDLEIAKYLVENGTDINAKDSDWGYTALIYAAEYVNLEIVQFLIESVADVNIKNNDGKTALDFAEENNYKNIIELLKNSIDK